MKIGDVVIIRRDIKECEFRAGKMYDADLDKNPYSGEVAIQSGTYVTLLEDCSQVQGSQDFDWYVLWEDGDDDGFMHSKHFYICESWLIPQIAFEVL